MGDLGLVDSCGLRFDVCAGGVRVNGVLLSDWSVEGFSGLLGEPRWSVDRPLLGRDPASYVHYRAVVWDGLGVRLLVTDRVVGMYVIWERDAVWRRWFYWDCDDEWPSSMFMGELTVKGRPVVEVSRQKLSRMTIAVGAKTGDYKTTAFLTSRARLQLDLYAGLVPPPPGDPKTYLATAPGVFGWAGVRYVPKDTG